MKALICLSLAMLISLAYRCTPGVSSSSPMLQVDAADPALAFSEGRRLYNNQPFSGYIVSYYAANRLQSKEYYQQGKQEGLSQRWYGNGQLAESRFYTDNRKTGNHQGWWANGTKRFDYTFANDIPVGHHQTWYETGQRFSSFHYNDQGHEAGLQQLWYETGQVKANFEVRNGRRFGLLGAKGCEGK